MRTSEVYLSFQPLIVTLFLTIHWPLVIHVACSGLHWQNVGLWSSCANLVNKDILGTYDVFLVQFVNVYCNVVVFFIESKVEEGGHRESLTHLHVTAICSRCAKKEEYKSW